MENFIIEKNLNKDVCEIMHNSMLESVFRSVELSAYNGCSKLEIRRKL